MPAGAGKKIQYDNIIQAMVAITRDIGAIEKEQQAPSAMGGFRFRGIDQVLGALNPQLSEKGVALQVEVLEVGSEIVQQKNGASFLTTAKVRYTFHLENGTTLAHTVVGQGMDRADKGVAKALSTAFKSMAFQVFCIPTDEALDTEHDSHEEPAASHAAQRSQERGDPPPPQRQAPPAESEKPKITPNSDGITEKMAMRLMMAGKERADADGVAGGDRYLVLNHSLNAVGLQPLVGEMTWYKILQQLVDGVPSKRIAENVYGALYDHITEGPGMNEPAQAPTEPQGDDDIPF